MDLSDLDGSTGASDATLGSASRASAVSVSVSASSQASTTIAASTSAASSTASGDYRDVVLADGPAIYLRFEGAGPDLFDEVSQSVVGTAVDDVTFGRPGAFEPRSGTAVELHEGHLALFDDAPVAWQGVDPYTVEMWFNPHEDIMEAGIYPRLFTRETSGPRDGIVLALTLPEVGSETCRVVWERFAADVQDQAAAPAVPTVGFTHLVGTFDGEMLKVFVNGAEVVSTVATTSLDVTASVRLGAIPGAPSTQLKANLDEVALYGKALTAAQIAAHYDARLP